MKPPHSVLSLVLFRGCGRNPTVEPTLWSDDPEAARYEPWWPDSPFLAERRSPDEAWFEVDGHRIHLDRLPREGPITVIALHGGGGHGRLLLPFALPLWAAGYEVVAPDLPHYGRSIAAPGHVTWDTWVRIVSTLVDAEHARGKRVVLYGLSIGGMTAYHVAAENPRVEAVIASTLLDLRDPAARDAAASSRFVSRVISPIGAALPWLLDGVGMKAGYVGKLSAMSSDAALVEALSEDPRVGQVVMPAAFFRTLREREPAKEPEHFDRRLLLAHPGADAWTPLPLSQGFFDRLGGPKRLVILPGGGHIPFEREAFDALQVAILGFLAELPTR